MKLRIPLGKRQFPTFRRIVLDEIRIAIMIIAVLIAAGVCQNATAAELVVAQSAHWRTTAYLTNTTQSEATFSYLCTQFGVATQRVTIPPFGAVRIDDLVLCDGIRTLTIPPGISAISLLSFDDGKTHASFAVQGLSRLHSGVEDSRLGPITNDDAIGTYLNLFATEPSGVTVDVYDGRNRFISSEYVTVSPPVTQHRIRAALPVGFLVISLGARCGNCQNVPPVTGFVSVSDVRGGNARVLPIN
ncbi:MAG TPA: hypothetical protein VNL91_04230 [Thermoanaerobaculia bacterium]|nr:hypothetical protein [Thermoanaerobaculia bacterium]